MEVTVWNFQETSVRALNLFSDGSISGDYLLARGNRTQMTQIFAGVSTAKKVKN